MRDYEKRKIHKQVKFLKEHVSLSLPVSVRIVEFRGDSKKDFGHCLFDGHRVVVRINSRYGYQQAIDALRHEWAHARVICQGFDHGDVWGREYSIVYTAMEEAINDTGT